MKKIIRKINNFFKGLFDKAFSVFKKNSEVAVKVTQYLKIFVESNAADTIVNIIPGDLDDVILKQLKLHVPRVAFRIALLHKIMQESDNMNEAVSKIISYLQTLNPEARIGFWITFAGELNIALSDGKISHSEAVILTQLAYKEAYER
jgi:hypothetical protein